MANRQLSEPASDEPASGNEPAPGKNFVGAASRRLANGREDFLIEEAPLLLDVSGQQLVTMRTPGRDAELALGFLLGEGIVTTPSEVLTIECTPGDNNPGGSNAPTPDRVRIELAKAPEGLAKARLARTHEIRSSCGACGITDPHALLDDAPGLLPGVPRVATKVLTKLVAELTQRQQLFSLTGGSHAALLADNQGNVLAAAEDVGRHNALDKAIGEAANKGMDLTTAIAVLSGRMGFDLVVKCLRVRIPIMVSVSAPSALAFDLCQAAGATLL
ncbi:MAG: FdhD protein, partial [Planctomycetota bacterium]